MSGSFTNISQVGEFGLIERLKRIVEFPLRDSSLHENLLKGISDDGAVLNPTPGKVQILTTDAFVEGVHFDLTFTSFKHLGWKIMAANLSDIAAMGGTPRYAVICLCLPDKISVEMVEELYEGLAAVCKQYNCLLIGGDTSTTFANLTIALTLLGEADEKNIVYRDGAKVNDVICVTGDLGRSHAGLKVLLREKEEFEKSANKEKFSPQLELYKDAIEKHLLPKPRFDIAHAMNAQLQFHAMIDISDGLASDLRQICEVSHAGAEIYEESIPILPVTRTVAAEFSENARDYALYGGEDYELLVTLDEKGFEQLKNLVKDISMIGRITEPSTGIVTVQKDGARAPLRMGGWDHFRRR